MKRILTLAAIAAVTTGPAFAASMCSTAPMSKWQSKATLTAQLKKDGLTVRRIKSEGGCYEVYAVDTKGKKVNVAYNAETLKKVSSAEAGEG